MAEKSSIAWCRSTFNPWIGCTKIGPGCDHCYAEVSTPSRTFGIKWGAGEPRKRTSPNNWTLPLKWNKQAPDSEFAGRKGFWPVFTASLADVFDNEVTDEWRKDLFDLIEATPNLSWLLVTKRIGNVPKMAYRWMLKEWPANVRLLITVVNQEEADRDIPKLLALNVKNGISYEPALGPIDFTQWTAHRYPGSGRTIEWVIIGGESTQGGAQARPFDIGWAYNTIDQCKAAGIAVFVKQIGSAPFVRPDGRIIDLAFHLTDRSGANPADWHQDLRVQEFPA